MEKKYVKVTDDRIYNRKIEFKAKTEIVKMNRNYKKVDEKIWRVLKCNRLLKVFFRR